MTIAVDFDGTVVTHKFPKIGEDVGAVPVLKALIENGHQIILNTMRSHKPAYINDKEVDTLQEAENWFKENGIELYGVNENPTQKSWTDSPKVYANLYIDDSAVGVPIAKNDEGDYFVNWKTLETFFKNIGAI